MDQQTIIHSATQYVNESPANIIQKDFALSEDVIGTRIFQEPLIGFSSVDDPLFQRLKEPEVIGPHFLHPVEWFPTARSVISFFLPLSKEVKKSNQRDSANPSIEWLHGRIEGQKFINLLAVKLRDELKESGYSSLIPSIDPRFKWGGMTVIDGVEVVNPFTSNWSERHAAFISGLGTFGLSKGLITQAGVAGRIGSIITEMELTALERDYSELYEHCSECGDCVRNCPAGAISLENGKNHPICNAYLEEILSRNKPYYGCGKCQVNVSCQDCIP